MNWQNWRLYPKHPKYSIYIPNLAFKYPISMQTCIYRRFSKPIDLTTQISSFSYQLFFIIQSKYNVQRVRFRNKIENPSRNMLYRAYDSRSIFKQIYRFYCCLLKGLFFRVREPNQAKNQLHPLYFMNMYQRNNRSKA